MLRITLGQARDSIPLLDEALSLIDEGAHHELACLILSLQGFGLFQLGDLSAARDCYRRGLVLAREHVDRRAEMSALKGLADVASEEGNHDDARANYQAAFSCARTLGDLRAVGAICCNQAILEAICGDLDEAERLADQGLALAREIRFPDLAAAISANLGILAVARLASAADSDVRAALIDLAIRRLVEALEVAQSSSNEQRQTHALYGAASAAYHAGDPRGAVALYGRADAISDQLGLGWEANMRETRETQLGSLRDMLGDGFEAVYEDGRTLPLVDAVRLVRDIER
jgi:tetratricopeptide (TPR) repeat protein